MATNHIRASGASVTDSKPFVPAAWLADFAAVGGGYIKTAEQFSLGWVIAGRPADEQQTACCMVSALTDADRAALISHLEAREA